VKVSEQNLVDMAELRRRMDEKFEYANHELNAQGFRDYVKRFMKGEHCRLKKRYAKGRQQDCCRNPTLAKCGGEAQHLEKLEVWSPPGLLNVQSSTTRIKTPRIGVFFVSLERSWNVDIENGLALAIRTSAAQVMGKRRAGSQTGSLTPDH
jgi:hypothetical protein